MYKNGQNPSEIAQDMGIFDQESESNALSKLSQNVETKVVYKTKRIEKILIFYDDGTFQDIPVK